MVKIKSNLLSDRNNFKPFNYPWAYDAWLKHEQSHWLHTEVPMAEDVKDWKKKLTNEEKQFLTHIFRFFTQGDIDVAGGYVNNYLPYFPQPEVRMMLLGFAAREALHVAAYSHLIETLGLPEALYNQFLEYQAMKDKHELIPQEIEKENKIGSINGMWANALGQGGILPLYAKYYPSNNFLELKLTGSLEKVMSESIHVAETLSFSLLSQEKKDNIYKEKKSCGIHIHAAEGAVSKDGPSGGVALTVLIYSLMNDYKIKQNFGITGEIDLMGNVCEIGGLDMKIIGSIKSGVTSFIFPKRNMKDYDKLVEKYKVSPSALDEYLFFNSQIFKSLI
jgi:hypothetical protein